ncbi:Golgi integral membrane protein 4a isoform X1 [Callorhinchus milii]|uniref:Golgi integral membrane protein 4a isoform X1 n=1 Tax=Callorhinchus milii TaxID=7868 RepID=UPI001C3F956C|nr:Golgi integral membrane protein 4a isoform X1 [Callorhinchus milii]
MGGSGCSRRQKRIFQTLLLLTALFGFLYGSLLYYEIHNRLRRAESAASKHQQHQEALSAQLQVVYEHRSRLEKSLQKERNEHKKAKEDFLVYKLEAQEALNKEKQDTSNRYSSLTMQHKMLKNQHEELKRQYTDLHEEHQRLGEDHSKAINEHGHRYLSLQQVKEQEIAKLKENIYNLLEENKKLRKAHQDVHIQLQDVRQEHKNLLLQHDQLQLTLEDHKNSLSAAQVQMEEYKQLKDTLNKMASLNTKQVQNAPYLDTDQTQQRNEEPKRTLYGADNTEPMRNSQQEDAQLQVKPMVGENDDTKTREEQGKHHHENWPRNDQPGQTAQRDDEKMQQTGQAEWQGHQQREHVRESEQPEREDQGMEHLEKHQQSKEEEGVKDEGNGNEHTDQENNDLNRNEPNEIERKRRKSPYEEQLEQQKLANIRAEEARKLKEHQETLHQQRLKEYMERQQYLQKRERELQEEAERKELLLRQEQLRQELEFQNEDVPEAEDEQDVREEEEEEEVDDENNPREEPEDVVNEDHRPEQEAMEQQVKIAGNPDQQEDNLDDQYQDEGEEEVQEDLIEEAKKVEENVEGPYTENENAEEKEGEVDEQDEEAAADNAKPDEGEKEDENYEEEEDEAEVPAVKMRRRGEM